MKKILSFVFLFLFSANISPIFANTHPFLFGLKIQGNNADIALNIENTYHIHLPVVGFFYDDFSDTEYVSLSDAVEKLGTENRMYHLTVNPLGYTAKELFLDPEAKGFKKKYERLFAFIKEKNIKVLFRFCHEMNGGWYSWASDPIYYPLMWQRVWQWSRDAGLDQKNILFDFSVNSEDLPRVGTEMPTQNSTVIPCNQIRKAKNECLTFEDYYPGSKYVDVMGITAYNWGLGARKEDWAYWRPFDTTVDEPGYYTFSRLKSYKKPLYIDEAGSTSIFYTGAYNPEKITQLYDLYHIGTAEKPAQGNPLKNEWIKKYFDFIKTEPVMGGSYFNVDVTYGLRDRSKIGELDWTIIDAERHFAYPVIFDILAEKDLIKNPSILFDMDAGSGAVISESKFDDFVQTIRKTVGFPLGDQIFEAPYSWGNKMVKYQRYAEKALEKTPALCQNIKRHFPELTCLTENNPIIQGFGDKIFMLFSNNTFTVVQKNIFFRKIKNLANSLPEDQTKTTLLSYINTLSTNIQ